MAGAGEGVGQVDGRLPAELDDGRCRCVPIRAVLVLQYVAQALLVQGLEVKAAGGVEVGGYRLRIGIDHNALVAGLLEGPGGVDAAVVELNPLADADRPAADDHRRLLLIRQGLVFLLVGGVEVGGGGVELGGQGVHHLVDGADVPVPAELAHLLRQPVGQGSNLLVREAQPFGPFKQLRLQLLRQEFLFHIYDVAQLGQEQGVYAGASGYSGGGDTPPEGGHYGPQPEVVGGQGVVVYVLAQLPLRVLPQQGTPVELQRAHRFLQCGLKAAVYGHNLAGGLHLGVYDAVSGGELVKRPARYLDHHVVQGRLKRGHRFARHLVGYLVQPLAHGYAGGHPGDGVAGGLTGQGRGAADAGIDLYDIVAAAFGVQGELDVTAALHTQRPDNLQGGGAQHLVFLVGQRLAGGDDDAVPGVDAHGIQVLHVTDGDAVVGAVAHDFVLYFLPADYRFLQQHLADGAGGQAGGYDALQFRHSDGDTAARPPQGVGRAYHQGQAHIHGHLFGLR